FSAIRAKRVRIARLFSKIKASAISVIQEDAVRRALAHPYEERDVFVQRVCRLLPAKRIGVPHREREIAVVQWPALIAQAEVVLILGHGLPCPKLSPVKCNWISRRVLRNHLALWIEKHHAKRGPHNPCSHTARIQRYCICRLVYMH